jgi:hypothetical protein
VLSLFLFPCLLDLFKKLHDAPLSYSDGLDIVRLRLNVASIFSFVTFHSKTLSTSCLTIRKYSSVITFNYFCDEVGDAQTFINIVLVVFRRENLVKVVNLATIEASCHAHAFVGAVFTSIMNHLDLCLAVQTYFITRVSLALFMT